MPALLPVSILLPVTHGSGYGMEGGIGSRSGRASGILSLEGDDLAINGMTYDEEPVSLTLPATLALSSHWRGYDPSASAIFNTESGQEMEVTIDDLGIETLQIQGQNIEARHLRMTGSLTVDLWYGPDGQWLKCEFEARGETVTYVLRAGSPE